MQRAAAEEIDRLLRRLNLAVLLGGIDQATCTRLKEWQYRVAIRIAIAVVSRVTLLMIREIGALGTGLCASEPVQRIDAAPVEVIEAAIGTPHISVDGAAGCVLTGDGARAAQCFLCAEAKVAQIEAADLITPGAVDVGY